MPIGATGDDVWPGFARGEYSRGSLWHSEDAGESWSQAPDFSDVRSVRHTSSGVLVAGKFAGKLGFFRLGGSGFEALPAPGTGDDLEVCGESDGEPVLRVDRRVYKRGLRPWWMRD